MTDRSSPDIEDDPSADERWQEGCNFAMVQLCDYLGVDPDSVHWDAATETVDGDVQAVLGNILRAKFGEDWGPSDGAIYAAVSKAETPESDRAEIMRAIDSKLAQSSAGTEDAVAGDAKAKLADDIDLHRSVTPEGHTAIMLTTAQWLMISAALRSDAAAGSTSGATTPPRAWLEAKAEIDAGWPDAAQGSSPSGSPVGWGGHLPGKIEP